MATLTIDDLRYYYYGGGSQAEMDFMQQCYDAGISAADVLAGGGGGGGTTIIVKDEGAVISGTIGTLNFVGTGVTATQVAGQATITVPATSGPAGGSLAGSFPNPTLAPTAVADLNAFTSTLKGLVPPSGGGTTNFLRADGTFAAPAGSGGTISTTDSSTVAFTGTGAAGSPLSATVPDTGITNAKLANMAGNLIKGRSGSTGVPQDLSPITVTAMLSVFDNSNKGLTPASGGGTANFLRADGTWAAPPSGGAASTVAFTPTTTIASTNVQAAIAELETDLIGLPTLTTSDTAKVPIATASGVTTLNVNNLISQTSLVSSDSAKLSISTTGGVTTLNVAGVAAASSGPPFLDTNLIVQDDVDPTKQVKFDCTNISTATTTTFTFPNIAGAGVNVLLTDLATQNVLNKTLGGPIFQPVAVPLVRNVTFRHDADPTYNDGSRSNPIEVNGNLSYSSRFSFLHHGAAAAGPAVATASGATIGQVNARGHLGAGYAATPSVSINMIADEAFTATAKGARMSFLAQPLGTITVAVEGLRITSSAATDVAIRSGLAVGAGSTMAAPASLYALEVKTDAIGYGVGAGSSAAQGTSRTTAVTVNKPSGAVTMFTATGSATPSSFVVNNSYVGVNDVIVLSNRSVTANVYLFYVLAVSAGSFTIGFQTTGGTSSDQPVINFQVHKGVIT